MTTLTPIYRPEDVTAFWLSDVLRHNGFDATVVGFAVKQIGTGQMARCFRYALDIEGDERAPKSLVAKFNSADPGTIETAIEAGSYSIEVDFYRSLAPKLPISTARCYFADCDAEGRSFVLVLADMAPATQADQMEGCSLAAARVALSELASMQAATWNDGSLMSEHNWLPSLFERQRQYLDEQRELTPLFLDRLGDRLEDPIVDLVQRMAAGYDNLVDLLDEQPKTLTYWDFRADNLLIDDTSRPPKITTVDWQTLHLGAPLQDVSYFMGASLTTDLRRPNEQDLLDGYYEKLIQLGVQDFSREKCRLGYQIGSFSGLTMAIRATALVEETERGNVLFATMAQRHGSHILDLKADCLLG